MKHTRGGLLAKFILLVACLLITAAGTNPVRAQTPAPEQQVCIYLFWGDGCPHCAKAKPYLESLPAKYPGVILRSYEIYYDQENQELFSRMAEKHGVERLAVPTIFIGPYYLQGYSEEAIPSIEKVVLECLQNGCVDSGEGLLDTPAATIPTPSQSLTTPQPASVDPSGAGSQILLNQTQRLEIPLLGSVNLQMQSAAVSTALIALVDGFNPCSLWVLSMLLALTLHTGSRKKVFLIGLIFLTVTAGIYALFILGLFSVLKIASFLGWIQILIGLLTLFFALVNIKDYFWYRQGISFTIADDQKTGIFKRMRAVMDASQTWWGLAGATVVLAAGVSMVEFSCTAGFPVVWVDLVKSQNIGGAAFILLLLLYMLIYQLDELIIFGSAVISLKSTRLEEKQGRLLKLTSGMLLLALSLVMLFNPAWMNNLGSSLVIFALAFAATLLVVLAHRFLLSKFGLRTETAARQVKTRHKSRINDEG